MGRFKSKTDKACLRGSELFTQWQAEVWLCPAVAQGSVSTGLGDKWSQTKREMLTGGDSPKMNANDLEIAFHSIYVSNVNKIFKRIPFKIFFKKRKKKESQLAKQNHRASCFSN